jgi:hypothetical protein
MPASKISHHGRQKVILGGTPHAGFREYDKRLAALLGLKDKRRGRSRILCAATIRDG